MTQRNGKLGMRALAKSTGYSVATISRALNRPETVNVKTRAAVLEAVERTGYRRNPAARALATARTHTIGAVVPTLSHSIFAKFLSAVEQELALRDYALVTATTDFCPKVEYQRASDLINLGAEGLLVSGADHDDALIDFVRLQGIPTVCSSVHASGSALPAIGYDNHALAEEAVTHLGKLGHRKLAVIHGPVANNDRQRLRLEGVRNQCQLMNITLHEHSVALSEAGGSAAASAELHTPEHATALLCLSDVLALGVYFEAARLGRRIPEDVSVMGFDDLPWSSVCTPALTTIQLPAEPMGVAVAQALCAALDDGVPINNTQIKAKLLARASTAAPASA